MATAKVLKSFKDVTTGKWYQPGDTFECPQKRMDAILRDTELLERPKRKAEKATTKNEEKEG